MEFMDKFRDKLRKKARFRKQEKILDDVPAHNTEYKEFYTNGHLTGTDILIDGESVQDL